MSGKASVPRPEPEALAPLGAALEIRLAELTALGVLVGPGERATVWALLSELVSRGAVSTIEEFEPYLAVVLARSPEQARLFETEETLRIEPVGAPPASARRRRTRVGLLRLWIAMGLAAALMAFGSAVYFRLAPDTGPAAGTGVGGGFGVSGDGGGNGGGETAAAPKAPGELNTPADAVVRILQAAGGEAGGAATLRLLAHRLSFRDMRSESAEGRALALAELSGAPLGAMLDLRIADGAEPVWIARLARALDTIERPGRVSPREVYRKAVAAEFEARGAAFSDAVDTTGMLNPVPSLGIVFERYERARPSLSEASRHPAVVAATPRAIVNGFAVGDRVVRVSQADGRQASSLDGLDPLIALMLEPGARVEIARDRDPTVVKVLEISTEHLLSPQAAPRPPNWTPLAAVCLPVTFGLIWLVLRFRAERAFLRRRTPIRPPTRTEHVADALESSHQWSDRDRQLTQLLQTREERETPEIDVPRSVAATLKKGGRLIALEHRRLRPAPDYLLLLERRDPNDQVAARMLALIEPFQRDNLVHFEVFVFQNDPGMVAPLGGGAYQPIEAIRARFPDHRLIILGTGRGFAPLAGGQPPASSGTLRQWERRVLLTPTPLSEWSATEFAVADALDAPVGRATRAGFYRVGELLGLEGSAIEARPDPSGDQSLIPLPEPLRLRPQRLFYEVPPRDYPLERVILDLRKMLDRDGFRWLCALAVYPALQWDLTLYLGVRLGAYTDDARGDKRVSTLTRLPWLQNGRMPGWLRKALIAELSPLDGADVYRLIVEALRDAERPASDAERRLVFRISRDRGADPVVDVLRPRLLEDEVLLDFLKKGDQGDFPLPRDWRAPSDDHRRAFLRRASSWRIILASAVFSGAAWLVAPSVDAPAATGTWLPLSLLMLGLCLVTVFEWLSRSTHDKKARHSVSMTH